MILLFTLCFADVYSYCLLLVILSLLFLVKLPVSKEFFGEILQHKKRPSSHGRAQRNVLLLRTGISGAANDPTSRHGCFMKYHYIGLYWGEFRFFLILARNIHLNFSIFLARSVVVLSERRQTDGRTWSSSSSSRRNNR